MKLYDEDGNFVGEFIKNTTENVGEAFSTSWILGILLLLIYPVWGIVVISLWFIFKMIFKLIALVFKIIWWIIRVPFCLIFRHEWPQFQSDRDSYYY